MYPIVYVDTSAVREGALEELKAAIQDLVRFVDSSEPRIMYYGIHLNKPGTRMSVVQVHPDAPSLEYHLYIGGPVFKPFAALLTLESIQVYGEVTEKLLEQLDAKVQLLGGSVQVIPLEAGTSHLDVSNG